MTQNINNIPQFPNFKLIGHQIENGDTYYRAYSQFRGVTICADEKIIDGTSGRPTKEQEDMIRKYINNRFTKNLIGGISTKDSSKFTLHFIPESEMQNYDDTKPHIDIQLNDCTARLYLINDVSQKTQAITMLAKELWYETVYPEIDEESGNLWFDN